MARIERPIVMQNPGDLTLPRKRLDLKIFSSITRRFTGNGRPKYPIGKELSAKLSEVKVAKLDDDGEEIRWNA